MIFVGDVSIFKGDIFEYACFPDFFFSDDLCLNLEGSVCFSHPDNTLKNHFSWFRSFSNFKSVSVSLSNNHVFDPPLSVADTLSRLSSLNFSFFGIGSSPDDASTPIVIDNFVLHGFGWQPIGCRAKSADGFYINQFSGSSILRQLRRSIYNSPSKKHVLVIHGNYEFELFPQPAHRQIALDLIDAGAFAVIFHHPHIVGPLEFYKGKLIAYSIGNWAFSFAKHMNGRLAFPSQSFAQIALQYINNEWYLYRCRFYPPNLISCVEHFPISPTDLTNLAPFSGLTIKEYTTWFRANRKKNYFLPIYNKPYCLLDNTLKDVFVIVRQFFVDILVRLRIKRLDRRIK